MFNRHDDVTVIIDNGYSAATGGQDIPSSRAANEHRQGNNSIVDAVKGVGVKWVKRIHTYDMQETLQTLREALTTHRYTGPKVIVAEGECQLNRQRRVRPLMKQAIKQGKRVVRERFGVDPGHLHRRSFVHSPFRLSVAHGQGESRSAAHRSRRARGQQLRGLRSVRRSGACGGAVPVVLSGGAAVQPVALGSSAERLRAAVIGALQRRSERRAPALRVLGT